MAPQSYGRWGRRGREVSVSECQRALGEEGVLGLEGCCKKAWLPSCLSRELKEPLLDLRQWGAHPWGARCFCGQGLCSLSGWLSATWLRTDMRDWLENCYAREKNVDIRDMKMKTYKQLLSGMCLSLWFTCPKTLWATCRYGWGKHVFGGPFFLPCILMALLGWHLNVYHSFFSEVGPSSHWLLPGSELITH